MKQENNLHKQGDMATEAHLRAVLETVIDGIITIDKQGIMQTINPAAEQIFGYSAKEMAGQNVKMLMPEPYAGEHDDYLHNYLTTGDKKIIGIGREVTGKRKDGSTFPMELSVSEMEVSGERMFTGIVRDITERKADEKILAEKNYALEIVAAYERTQSKVMALFSANFDQDTVFQMVLGLLAEAHQFPVSAVYLFNEWQGMLHCVASHGLPEGTPQDLKPGQGLIGQAAMDGKTMLLTAAEEMPFTIDTGLFSITPAAVVASPIIYGEKVLGIMALASIKPFDSSELGFIERLTGQMGVSLNNLNQYHDLKALAEQHKQRGREISQKNALLEQANRLKTEFLANMSHELRTPLNAIIGFSEVLKDQLLGELNPEQADYTAEIYDSANHLLSLINDILDLSKIEAGKMELYLEPVNMPEMLRNAMSIVKETAHSHNINLDLDVPDDIGTMLADGRKLKQVLFNLLSNAVKFTPDDGRVSVTVQRVEHNLVVRISDTGIGISKDNIGMLFRPFEQLDGSLSRQYEGTGLGLVMVKRLVELHGGQVSVTSQEGVGSCFQFVIPYREAGESGTVMSAEPVCSMSSESIIASTVFEAVSAIAPLTETPLLQPEVLLVEDNDKAAELMSIQLKDSGYRIYRASSGEEGLKLARKCLPDLVIMDILLPDFDGWEVMRRMNQDPALQDIPVVVVSIVADAKKGLDLGAVNVLEKPVHKQSLLNAIGQALPDTEPGTSTMILVVDDEEKAVQFMVTQLTAEGFQTVAAYGGQQAIDITRSIHPDIIILDLMMPEVTGFDVVATLRQEVATRDIPIIILTAKVLTAEDRQRLQSQVAQIVAKSEFDTAQFMDDVQEALARVLPKSPAARVVGTGAALVLVVEDNKAHADLLKLYLEDAGFRVVMAGNGREGLELMKREHPDLITLDLLMPEMDGFSFLEAKAGLQEYASIPVMVLSATVDQMDGSPVAADAVLRKPVRRAELLPLIENLLPTRYKKTGKRPKVLVVDDDPKAIKIVSSYLPEQHYDVISAFGGVDGIELAKTDKPDLIVLDLMMPEVSGFEVLAALKQDASTRDIPVVILTAKLLSRQEQQQLQHQVAAIAQKGNASREMLTGEIERILRRYQKL